MPELRYRSEPSSAAGIAANAQAVSWPGTSSETTPFNSGMPATGPSRCGESAGLPNSRGGMPKNSSAPCDQPRPLTSMSWEWLQIDNSFTIRPERRKLR